MRSRLIVATTLVYFIEIDDRNVSELEATVKELNNNTI